MTTAQRATTPQTGDNRLSDRHAYVLAKVQDWLVAKFLEVTTTADALSEAIRKYRVLERAVESPDLSDNWPDLEAEFTQEPLPKLEKDEAAFRRRRAGFHVATIKRFQEIGLLRVAWDANGERPERWTVADPDRARRVKDRLAAELDKMTADLGKLTEAILADYEPFVASLGMSPEEADRIREIVNQAKG